MKRRRKNAGNARLTRLLREMLPNVTLADFQEIEEIANRGHLRHLPPTIIAWQAVTTHIRHKHTDYDALLDEGYDAESARHFVLDALNEKLSEWGCARRVTEHPEDRN